jgi:hypothetical protein
MRRSLAVGVAVLIAWVSLGACYLGPDPIQYAALAMIDGHPTAVIASCTKATVHVTVFQNDGSTSADFHPWSVTVTLPKPARELEVELLGAPRPGWEITTMQSGGAVVVPLTSFDPGHHYTLDSSEGGPEGASAPAVRFSTDDLPTIGVDQVLAPIDHRKSEVVSREAFVRKQCP